MLYFIMGIIAPIAVSILEVVNATTKDVGQVIRWFFYPFPIFSLTYGYIGISNKQIVAQVAAAYNVVLPGSFSMEVAGPSLIFLIGSIPFYWCLVVMLEKNMLSCRRRGPNSRAGLVEEHQGPLGTLIQQNAAEVDVAEEHQRVAQLPPDNMPVRVAGITKRYGNTLASDNLSFGLEFGECFALLGVSGAGKTTCFKCLTGVVKPDSGSVTINGCDITRSAGFEQARKMIGYCPQFDAIFEGLTVREHLEIYAALKGIKANFRERLIEKAIKDMDLESYTRIRANNLSGGNKRKLSVAMAMLGNPPIVFLDEPSTGVDP